MKWLILFSFIVLFLGANAQSNSAFNNFRGVIHSCRTNESISYVHVVNETSSYATVADSSGKFSIKAKSGDIIRFSSLGMKNLFFEISDEKFIRYQSICLNPDTFLLNEITALPFSNFKELEHQFLAIKLKDNEYFIPGVTLKTRTTVHNLNDEKYIRSLGFALSSPISALYYNLSRYEKNIRKYYQLENDKWQQYEIDRKYNKTVVTSVTGLKNDKVIKFMIWCGFSKEYLLQVTDYELAIEIKEKFELYCESIEHK